VQPRWRGDGNSLYYLDSSSWISAVPVEVNGDVFRAGARERILATRTDPMLGTSHFAMAPDGKHFLVLDPPSAGSLNVIVDWQRLLAP
jgi:hypothetical protein